MAVKCIIRMTVSDLPGYRSVVTIDSTNPHVTIDMVSSKSLKLFDGSVHAASSSNINASCNSFDVSGLAEHKTHCSAHFARSR